LALIGNQSVLLKSHAFFTNGTATAGAYAANLKTNYINPSVLNARRINLAPRTSIPEGYNLGEAYLAPLKSGGLSSGLRIVGEASLTATGISARLSESALLGEASLSASLAVLTPGAAGLTGAGTMSASIAAVSSLASTLTGAATLTAGLSSVVPLAASMSGAATVAGNLTGLGRLEAEIDVGAGDVLSPTSLASAVWDTVLSEHVDTGTTGAALSDAGGAGNPWSADLSTNNNDGTFGGFVQKLLSVAKFLGLK
jgi:hypothetical protein